MENCNFKPDTTHYDILEVGLKILAPTTIWASLGKMAVSYNETWNFINLIDIVIDFSLW